MCSECSHCTSIHKLSHWQEYHRNAMQFKHSNCTACIHIEWKINDLKYKHCIIYFLRSCIFRFVVLRWYRQWHRHLYSERSAARKPTVRNLYGREMFDGCRSLNVVEWWNSALESGHFTEACACVCFCALLIPLTTYNLDIGVEAKRTFQFTFIEKRNVLANWWDEWALVINILNWLKESSSFSQH